MRASVVGPPSKKKTLLYSRGKVPDATLRHVRRLVRGADVSVSHGAGLFFDVLLQAPPLPSLELPQLSRSPALWPECCSGQINNSEKPFSSCSPGGGDGPARADEGPGAGGKENRARKAEGMPAMRPTSPGGDFLQGWGNIVIVLVVLHLLALAFWVYKVMSEPTSRHIGRKTEADKE